MPITDCLIFFFDRKRPDHLYIGTWDQVDHLRDVEGGASQYVCPKDIRFDGSTGRVAFSYQDYADRKVSVEDAGFSIAPPSWATGGSPTVREWDAAGPDATAASIMLGRKPTTTTPSRRIQWSTSPVPCPDCCVMVGELHAKGCDIERCPDCGYPWFGCSHRPENLAYPRIPWTGERPGDTECAEFGWYAILDPEAPGWIACEPGTPGSTPDINRLYKEAAWDPKQARFVREPVPPDYVDHGGDPLYTYVIEQDGKYCVEIRVNRGVVIIGSGFHYDTEEAARTAGASFMARYLKHRDDLQTV